jgi:alpha-glucuronidase
MNRLFRIFTFLLLSTFFITLSAENGYDLWLRYPKVDNAKLAKEYLGVNKNILFPANTEVLQAAKKELAMGLEGMLNIELNEQSKFSGKSLVIGTPESNELIAGMSLANELKQLDDEGYIIRTVTHNKKTVNVIAAKKDIGVLYGVYHYLRLMQTAQSLNNLAIKEEPKLQIRILNHWDNLNGTIERGYAGYTIWEWQRLPGYMTKRYTDYARANASIGINGTVLNNVNANANSLRTSYIIKAAAIADALRPYGVKVYLTARFSAPREIGGLKTADPLDPEVRQWWKDKAKEIYEYIPDFGGFLVKANSEGQPGPQDYKRTHADGANMMAEALEPFGGVVMWRAFVYHNARHIDRAINAYDEFKPMDGQFAKNVLVQPKNGPIDFQPREPFHPLFGAMPQTPLLMEFQITQEYLGYATHLAYLGSMFEETLQSDTYNKGKGSTVSKVLQDYKRSHGISGIAGVSNIGSDLNWTGHLFGQANWHAFGRMAWNPDLSAKEVGEEWARMTFSNSNNVLSPVMDILLTSREAVVNYTGPLGLNHIMNFATHYGPGPWYKDPNWDAKDYHKADETGLGVDRTTSGSNAVSQYFSPLREQLNNVKTCPQEFMLWFHHVPWDYQMPSGRIMWDELVHYYHKGVQEVRDMRTLWNSLDGKIDPERHHQVKSMLKVQEDEAIWWRDGCLLYFQTFSNRPIPAQYEQPKHSLQYYRRIPFPYEWKEEQYK